MSSDFGGLGFVPGVARGTRSFNIDKLGRLRGISYDQIWTPGENEAICRNYEGDYYGLSWGGQAHAAAMSMKALATQIYGSAGGTYSYANGGVIRPTTTMSFVYKPTNFFWHDPTTNAYYDSLGNMIATDEAAAKASMDPSTEKGSKWTKKGKKLLGPKSEAYPADDFDILEEKRRLEEEEKAEALRVEKEREEKRKNHGMEGCGHGFYAYYEGSNDYGASERVSAVIEGYGETIIGTRGFRSKKARIVAFCFGEEVTYSQKRMVMRNYPLVPVFESFDKMVSEFPSEDGGMGKQPITPENTPDFWTRSDSEW